MSSRKQIELPMGVQQIQEVLPHRYPMLLIDKVLELTAEKSVVALRNVSISDPILQGHFPGQPVLPGVMIVEGMAQAAGILGRFSLDHLFKEVLLTEVSETRFRAKVVPGDTLLYKVCVEKKRGHFFWFQGQALVEDKVVASAKFSAFIK